MPLHPRLLALLLAAIVTPAAAQQAVPGAIEQLKPGEFLWAPEIAPEGPVTIIVSLATQRAYAYRNGVPIAVSTVSTGMKGHETPVGVFTILQKKVDHRSNLYANAPMPFMQRLTWDGVALHAGRLPGYPASHGCVRLPIEFARRLFAITRTGVTVVVTDEAAVPEVAPVIAPAPEPLAPSDDGHTAPSAWSWTPERAPAGPLSIVVSGRDRSIVVLRNGVPIGRARVRLDAPIAATAAFTLRAVDADGTTHWMRLPLPGQPPAEAGELTAAERSGGHVPAGFRRAVLKALRPGTTMLVTRDTIATSGTGTRLRVIDTGE